MSQRIGRNWHPEDIKAAVRKKGWTLSELARTYGLSDVSVRRSLRKPHFYGELAIAEILGLSPRQIWPSRFETNGTRKARRRRSAKINPNALMSHGLKAEAA